MLSLPEIKIMLERNCTLIYGAAQFLESVGSGVVVANSLEARLHPASITVANPGTVRHPEVVSESYSSTKWKALNTQVRFVWFDIGEPRVPTDPDWVQKLIEHMNQVEARWLATYDISKGEKG